MKSGVASIGLIRSWAKQGMVAREGHYLSTRNPTLQPINYARTADPEEVRGRFENLPLMTTNPIV